MSRHGNAVRLRGLDATFEVISDESEWLLLRLAGGRATRWARVLEFESMSRPAEPTGDADDLFSGLDSLPDRTTGHPMRVGDRVGFTPEHPLTGVPRAGVIESFVTIDGAIHVLLVGCSFPMLLSNVHPVVEPTVGHRPPKRCSVIGYRSAPAARHGCRAPMRRRVRR